MKKTTLSERAESLIRQNSRLAALKPVIEKELIHYDIFFLLQQKSLILPEMGFISGTCLRLCHGSNRYSEDLDFHAGTDFEPQHFDSIRLEIERYLADRYGLAVEVRSPKQLKNDPNYANSQANTWKIIIKTHESRRDIPAQRVHIDIANVPTHDATPQLIKTHYSNLPDGYDMMLFKSSSKSEILADKLLAIPARNNIKARDLWDVIWLQQQGALENIELLRLKLADHRLEHYKTLLEARINTLPVYFEKPFFVQEMSRFIDSTRLADTIKRPEFVHYVNEKIMSTLTKVHSDLYTSDLGNQKSPYKTW